MGQWEACAVLPVLSLFRSTVDDPGSQECLARTKIHLEGEEAGS